MQLKYQGSYSFSTADIGDFNADPPLLFTAVTYRSKKWLALSKELLGDTENIKTATALNFCAEALLTVGQDGQTWPITGLGEATEMMEAIEANGQGTGESFIRHLALAIIVMLARHDEEQKKKLEQSGPASENGSKASKSKRKQAKQK